MHSLDGKMRLYFAYKLRDNCKCLILANLCLKFQNLNFFLLVFVIRAEVQGFKALFKVGGFIFNLQEKFPDIF
jgi:hypothetical protein